MGKMRLQSLIVALLMAWTAARAGAAFGDFTYHTAMTPDALMSPAGDMMAMFTGQTPASLNADSPGGVAAHAGMVCLMSDPGTTGSGTISGQYTINLFITDTDSGQSGTFALTPSQGLVSQITIPSGGIATATTTSDLPPSESAVIGSALYSVSAFPNDFFTPPGAPLDKGEPGPTGGFLLHISATPAPEPAMLSTFVCIVGALSRRRRAAPPKQGR